MKKILFGWVTKPYIQWNFIDGLLCTIVMLLFLSIIFLIVYILDNRK